MSFSISQLFAKRKQEQFDSQRSVRQQYLAAVRLLATGVDEIDDASIIELIDQLNITESQLQADIQKQHSRNQAFAELQLHRAAIQDVQKLSAESQRLANEKQRFMDQWSPKMESVATALKAATTASLVYSQAEKKLMGNVLDPELVDRQRDLENRRQHIGQQLYALQGDIQRANGQMSHARSMLQSAEATEILEGAYDQTTKVRERNKQRAIADAQSKLDEAEKSASQIFGQRDRLNDQMRQIDVEQLELNRQKLNP